MKKSKLIKDILKRQLYLCLHNLKSVTLTLNNIYRIIQQIHLHNKLESSSFLKIKFKLTTHKQTLHVCVVLQKQHGLRICV